MKTIKSFSTAAIIVASLLLSSKASAQVTVSIENDKSDYQDFTSKVQDSHPGGWNFDIIGMNVGAKKKSSKKSAKNYTMPSLALFSGWGFGCSTALNADPGVDISMGRSFNFCIEDVIAVRMHPWKTGTLSLGYGIDLRNYTLSGKKCFNRDENDNIEVSNYEDMYGTGSKAGSSKIRTLAAATFNLKYIQSLGRGFRLAVGPELYITDSYGRNNEIKNSYTAANGKDKVARYTKIKTNKVGMNVVGVLNYKNLVGVYAKYSPTKLIEKDFCNNANFQTLSVGVMLFGL